MVYEIQTIIRLMIVLWMIVSYPVITISDVFKLIPGVRFPTVRKSV